MLDGLLEKQPEKKIRKWRINKPFLEEAIHIYIDDNPSISFDYLMEHQQDIIDELNSLHYSGELDLASYQTKESVLEKYMKGIRLFERHSKIDNQRIIDMLKNETN